MKQTKLTKEAFYKTLEHLLIVTTQQHYFFYLIFTFLILLSFSIHSQQADLAFEHFSVDEGMPTNVQRIIQDRTGYLWFATWGGLYKYDGYNFLSYKHDPDDSTSIIDNTLSTLYEDKAGILWIGTSVGLEKFDRITGSFTYYKPNPSVIENDASNNIRTICEDKNNVLWIGTFDGLYKFDRATGKFICMLHKSTDPRSISHNSIQTIYKDKEGSLWIGTGAGLDKYDFETGKFIHYWNDPNNIYKPWYNNTSMYRVNAILKDDKAIMWLGTNGGLVEFNSKDSTFFQYPLKLDNRTVEIYSICQDFISGCLWITTKDELFSFDKKSKKFTFYGKHDENFVTIERSGTLWIGTKTGIKKLYRIKQPFKKYPISTIAYTINDATDGNLWICLLGRRILKFDITKEKFISYLSGKDSLYHVFPEGDLAFLTKEGGFYIKDKSGKKTFALGSSWKNLITSLSFLYKTNKGYWAGSQEGGLYFMEPKTNQVLLIEYLKQIIDLIYEDKLGMLWISTYMGKLFCYDQVKDTLIEFISDIKKPTSISGRQINQIYEDKKGRLWFAANSGLSRYERDTKSFINFTEKNGLLSNSIRGILEDDNGYLWLNTNKGISKFSAEGGSASGGDHGKNHFKNYDISFGIEPASDQYVGIGCKTKNGEMYFPGARGFTRFHPDSVKDNPFIPPIAITSFKKFDKPYPFSNEINLPYDENFISFEFVALSYISPERNQYAYKMEGLDKDWVYSGTRRYASYPNLDPGEYVFKVKGSNNDGIWNEAGTSISIIISPPLWKTTWAYILYSILILNIIYFTWKMQVKRIKIGHEYEMSRFEAEKLHEVDELKARFFANISHEFRTPLTLILGPVKQIIEKTKEDKTRDDLKVVHKNANKLLGLVNQLLDISKLESGNMKLQTIPQNIIPLLKALVLSFTSYAERKRIALKFNSSEEEIIAYIDKDKIEKIITNVLSNAFKFTPEGGRIEVTISKSVPNSPLESGTARPALAGKGVCQNAEIKIADTGIGISKEKLPKIFDRFYQVDGSHTREQEGTGIGLSLTKELVELHKGKIEVESEEGKGTTFTISIPLGKEHLKAGEIVEPVEVREKTCQPPWPLSCTGGRLADKDYDKDKLILEVEDDIRRKKDEKIDPGIFEKELLPLLLIVEDNSDVRNYIKNNFNKDYRILEGVDGEDSWNKSIEQIPDLIVSDVMMPKMDGFKLCEKLKTDERTSYIPVILLTAKAASSDKIEGLEIGADDYIMKPFEPDELRARIKNLIEQRKRIHEHFKKHGLIEIEEKNITPIDQKFIYKAFEIINKNMSDTTFDLESFAESINLSRSVLHRKITSLTGESPGELIRRIRLKKAAQLIEQKFGNISEISLEVGFSNPSQFARSFQKQFGVAPSIYQQKFTNNSN